MAKDVLITPLDGTIDFFDGATKIASLVQNGTDLLLNAYSNSLTLGSASTVLKFGSNVLSFTSGATIQVGSGSTLTLANSTGFVAVAAPSIRFTGGGSLLGEISSSGTAYESSLLALVGDTTATLLRGILNGSVVVALHGNSATDGFFITSYTTDNTPAHTTPPNVTIFKLSRAGTLSLPAYATAGILQTNSSGDVSTGSIPVALGGTGRTTAPTANKFLIYDGAKYEATAYDATSFLAANSSPTLTGTWTFNNTIAGNINGNSATATKLATARTISITGAATGSQTFDGSANISLSLTLAAAGTPGTYTSVTTDSFGRVTAGTNPTTLSGYGITDALRDIIVTRGLPTVVNDYIEIGNWSVDGSYAFMMSITVDNSGIYLSKSYLVNTGYSQTGGAWHKLAALTNSGSYSGQDFEVDIRVNTTTLYLRIRRSLGTGPGNANIHIVSLNKVSAVWAATSGTGSTTAPSLIFNPLGGGGAGIDADTLNGQAGSYYLNWGNFSNTPTTVQGYGITNAVRTDLGGTIDGGNLQIGGSATDTEILLIPRGSNSAPSIAPIGGTGTGLHFPSSTSVGVTVGSATQFEFLGNYVTRAGLAGNSRSLYVQTNHSTLAPYGATLALGGFYDVGAATFDTYGTAANDNGAVILNFQSTLTAPKFQFAHVQNLAAAAAQSDVTPRALLEIWAPQTAGTNAANYFRLTATATANDPLFEVTGSDTNVGMRLQAKGTGVFTFLSKILAENNVEIEDPYTLGVGTAPNSTVRATVRNLNPAVASNATNSRYTLSTLSPTLNISTGVVDSGSRVSLRVDSTISDSQFLGTLAALYGTLLTYGHSSGAGVGTLTTAYGLRIEGESGGSSTVGNAYGIYETSTIANTRNYLQSRVVIGSEVGWTNEELYVVGNVKFTTSAVIGTDLTVGTTASHKITFPGYYDEVQATDIQQYRNVAAYDNTSSSATGTLKIILPVSWTNSLVTIRVLVTQVGGASATELILSGFNGASTWTQTRVFALGTFPGNSVRFGHDGIKCCILIGTTAAVWSYPKITIQQVTVSRASLTSFGTGWGFQLLTSESGITVSSTPTINGDFQTSVYATDVNPNNDTIALRNSSGELYATYFRSPQNADAASFDHVVVQNQRGPSTDNAMRTASLATFKTRLALGEADIPDGTIFPRLAATETITGLWTVSRSVAAPGAQTDYMRWSPSDWGTGKPFFYIQKSTTASRWDMGLYDGVNSNGTLNVVAQNFLHNNSAILDTTDIGTSVQNYSAFLTDVVANTGIGILVRTSSVTAVSRSIAVGSSKLSVTNASGNTGNPTLDVVEANLTLGNLGGTLGVAKGGTGAVTLTGYVKGAGTAALTASATIPEADIADGTIFPRLAANETVSGAWAFSDTITSTAGAALNNIYLNGATSNWIIWSAAGAAAPTFTTRSVGTKLILYPNIGAAAVDWAIGVESQTLWFSTSTAASGLFKWYGGTTLAATLTGTGGFTTTGSITSGNNLTVAETIISNKGSSLAAAIILQGSTQNYIGWSSSGVGAPTVNTRSVGTKLLLYPALGPTSADFSIGIDAATLWFAVTTTAAYFQWYGGQTLAATLTGTGALTLVAGLTATTGTFSSTVSGADPTADTHFTTKGWVENRAAKDSVRVATTASIAASSTSTTITTANNVLAIDAVTLALNDRVLIKNESTTHRNGIYYVSTVGTSGTPTIFTRATDAGAWTDLPGAFTSVEEGTVNSETSWVCAVNRGGTLGTTAVTFQLLSNKVLAYMGAVTPATDAVPYFTSSSAASVFTVTSLARTLLDDTSTTTMQTTLGLPGVYTRNAVAETVTAIWTMAPWASGLGARKYLQLHPNNFGTGKYGLTFMQESDTRWVIMVEDGTSNYGQLNIVAGNTNAVSINNYPIYTGANFTAGSNYVSPTAALNSIEDVIESVSLGFVAKGGQDIAVLRTLTAGSSKISITNGNGASGNPTIDVAEANITITNLSGTLTVAKGGTGATTLTGYVKGNGTSIMTASATVPEADIADGTILARLAASETITGFWTVGVTSGRQFALQTAGGIDFSVTGSSDGGGIIARNLYYDLGTSQTKTAYTSSQGYSAIRLYADEAPKIAFEAFGGSTAANTVKTPTWYTILHAGNMVAGTDYLAPSAIGTTVQAFDGDLSAIAALATNGLAERTGTNTWAIRAIGVGATTSIITRADGDGRYGTLSASANVWSVTNTFNSTTTFAAAATFSNQAAAIFADAVSPATYLRIIASSGVNYIQAGLSNSDTAAALRLTRFGTTTTNMATLDFYADLTTFRGNLNMASGTTMALGTAAPNASIFVNLESTPSANANWTGYYSYFSQVAGAQSGNRSHIQFYARALLSQTVANLGANSLGHYGFYSVTETGTDVAHSVVYGTYSFFSNNATHATNKTVASVYGTRTYISSEGTSSVITSALGLDTQLVAAATSGTATITNAYGVRAQIIQSQSGSGVATIGTAYLFQGVYAGTINTAWGIHLTGEDKNYFSAKLLLGTLTDPGAGWILNAVGSGAFSGGLKAAQLLLEDGQFSVAGDLQGRETLVRVQTTTATPAELLIAGSTRYLIASNTIAVFDITVMGVRTDASEGTAETVMFQFKGVISNIGGTTSMPVPVKETVFKGASTAAWDVAVTADNTNDALIVTATGAASKTIRWSARIRATHMNV